MCPAHAADTKKQVYVPEGVEEHAAKRRRLAAEYLVSPAPPRIRALLAAALADPVHRPWLLCPPPFACTALDNWAREHRRPQHAHLLMLQHLQQQDQLLHGSSPGGT